MMHQAPYSVSLCLYDSGRWNHDLSIIADINVSKCSRISKTVLQMAGIGAPSVFVGAEAVAKRDVLEILYPIERGIVSKWDDLGRLWQHAFVSELQRDPAERKVLFTEPPMNPKSNREKIVTMAFENFNVQGTYIANSAVLALYASSRTTGLVLNSGDGVTHTVPIYEGFASNKTVGKLDLGGVDLTGYMENMLAKEGISLTTNSEFETARHIKEELCYVSSDVESEEGDDGGQYTLPDGHVISVGEARYQVPEALFNPNLGQGIHNLVFDSVMKSDIDTRISLFGKVVLVSPLHHQTATKAD